MYDALQWPSLHTDDIFTGFNLYSNVFILNILVIYNIFVPLSIIKLGILFRPIFLFLVSKKIHL